MRAAPSRSIPFMKRIHYCRGCALEAEKQNTGAVTSFEKLLKLRPANPSEVRFRLARLLKPEDEKRSKRYLLDALAEAPRYREAQELLLAFQPKKETEESEKPKPPAPAPAAPPGAKDPFGAGRASPARLPSPAKKPNP